MDTFNLIIDNFLKFNQNAFYFILYFLKNYWFYLIVVGAICLLCSYELKDITSKFVKEEKRIV